jgi:hypothetical protein
MRPYFFLRVLVVQIRFVLSGGSETRPYNPLRVRVTFGCDVPLRFNPCSAFSAPSAV